LSIALNQGKEGGFCNFRLQPVRVPVAEAF